MQEVPKTSDLNDQADQCVQTVAVSFDLKEDCLATFVEKAEQSYSQQMTLDQAESGLAQGYLRDRLSVKTEYLP
jgi:hypothetical protein